jgi:hypothetical protein
MLLTGVFFALALIILAYVKEGRGRDAALSAQLS